MRQELARFLNQGHCSLPNLLGLPADAEADEGLLKDVEFYALDSRQESILWDVQPVFVVVYDPDVTFVRQLEVCHDSCMRSQQTVLLCPAGHLKPVCG